MEENRQTIDEDNRDENSEKSLIDIWGDNVSLRDLGIAALLCVGFTLGGYLIAPPEPPAPLIYGLIGGVIGFIISSIIIKPKRKITHTNEKEE